MAPLKKEEKFHANFRYIDNNAQNIYIVHLVFISQILDQKFILSKKK